MMNNKVFRRDVLASIAAAITLMFVPAKLTPQEAIGSFPKDDAVMVIGKRLSALLGVPTSSLKVAAIQDRALTAIPFQVDEVRDGVHVYDWVSPLGAELGHQTSDVDEGKLDADDELVFMAWDLGPRAGATVDFGADKALELAITDPASKQTRYAYLLMNSELPLSRKDYVELAISNGRTKVSALNYQYSQLEPAGYFDDLKIMKTDGGWTENLVEKNQSPAELEVKLIGLKGEVDFLDMVMGETIAKKDGPVRALWRCTGSAAFGPFRIKGDGQTEFVFLANQMNQQIALDIPFNFDSVLASFNMRGTLIMNAQALPADYYYPGAVQAISLDHQPESADGPLLGDKPGDWFVVSGWDAYLLNMITFPDQWTPRLARSPYVADGKESSEAGLYVGDMAKLLSTGQHTYWFRLFFFPGDFKPGDETNVALIAGRKLNIEVRTLP